MVSRHLHDEAWFEETVLFGVLAPSPRWELHDGLKLNVQRIQLLPDLGFGHALAQVFQQ
jgi:hypothetical protein